MKYLNYKIRKFFFNNYRKNKTLILYMFRWDILKVLRESWFRSRLNQNFDEIVRELKEGKTDRFDFTIHGGGNSHQRRKMKRAIIKNIVDNFYKYKF